MKDNKEIKSDLEKSVEGISLALAFILSSSILLFLKSYFPSTLSRNVIVLIFGITGMIGFLIELDEIAKRNNVIGMSDIYMGVIFIVIGLLPLKIHIIFSLRVVIFICLCLGIYSIIKGIIMFIYTFFNNKKKSKTKLISKDTIGIIATTLGIILAILQIIVAVSQLFKLI